MDCLIGNPNTWIPSPSLQERLIQEIRDKIKECLKKKEICEKEADDYLKKFDEFIEKVKNTPGKPLLRNNDCWKWVEEVSPYCPQYSGVFVSWDVTWVYKYLPNSIFTDEWTLTHSAIELHLCDDSVYYLDDGWWGDPSLLGGKDHIFKPEQIPWNLLRPHSENPPLLKRPKK
jgi:hypothetical protein